MRSSLGSFFHSVGLGLFLLMSCSSCNLQKQLEENNENLKKTIEVMRRLDVSLNQLMVTVSSLENNLLKLKVTAMQLDLAIQALNRDTTTLSTTLVGFQTEMGKLGGDLKGLREQVSKIYELADKLTSMDLSFLDENKRQWATNLLDFLAKNPDALPNLLGNADRLMNQLMNCTLSVVRYELLNPDMKLNDVERQTALAKIMGDLKVNIKDFKIEKSALDDKSYFVIPENLVKKFPLKSKELIPVPGSKCEELVQTGVINLERMLTQVGGMLADLSKQGDTNRAVRPMVPPTFKPFTPEQIKELEKKLEANKNHVLKQWKTYKESWEKKPEDFPFTAEVREKELKLPELINSDLKKHHEKTIKEIALQLRQLNTFFGRAIRNSKGEDLKKMLQLNITPNLKVDFEPKPNLLVIDEIEVGLIESFFGRYNKTKLQGDNPKTPEQADHPENLQMRYYLVDLFYFLWDRQHTQYLIAKSKPEK